MINKLKMWIASLLYIIFIAIINLIKLIKVIILDNALIIILIVVMVLFLNCVDNEKLAIYMSNHIGILSDKISLFGINFGLLEIITLLMIIYVIIKIYYVIFLLFQQIRKYICNIFLVALWIHYKLFSKTTNEFMDMESENMKQRIIFLLIITGIVTLLIVYEFILSPALRPYAIDYFNETVMSK